MRARRLSALALGLVVVVVVLIVVISTSASPTTGYDVSFPQCSGGYPGSPLFGIVGVNGGVASTANPCLASELSWARGAPGQRRPAQTRLSLYINTGDPGTKSAKWPKSGTAPAYGACNGLLTNACSYLYGEQRAAHSYSLVAASDAHAAATAPWWLDVELQSSWAGTYQLNIAALQGFVAGLHTAGVTGTVGIYSTSVQWKELTGLTAASTPTAFNTQLPDWIAGTGATLAQARANCADGGFTGATPTLAQYQLSGRDADLRCPAA